MSDNYFLFEISEDELPRLIGGRGSSLDQHYQYGTKLFHYYE